MHSRSIQYDKSIVLECVHQIMGWLQLMNKFKKHLLLAPFEQLSVKYFSIIQIFMKLFPKVSDTTKVVSGMKWVKCNSIQCPYYHSCPTHNLSDKKTPLIATLQGCKRRARAGYHLEGNLR